MISRGEAGGLAAAIVAHGALFALLAVGFLSKENRPLPRPPAMEVSLVDAVALDMAAPEISTEAEAAKHAETEAPVEPEPAPAEPEPQPVAKPDPPKPAAKPDTAERRRPDRSSAAVSGSGASRRPGGGLPDYSREFGRADRPSEGESSKPPAAMTGEAAADIRSAIVRQVQPCADRQVSPGPGADRITVQVRLQINRDGSLAAPPQIVDHSGVDDTNERYVRRVDDAVKAIFAACSPLRGLPPELYDVVRGWKTFRMNYRLRA